MKKLIFVFIGFFLLMSCSKEETSEVCLNEICIDGEWTWVESYGSIAGHTITPESESITRRLVIDDINYQEFVDDELILDTEYEYVESDELDSFTIDGLVLKLATGNWLAVTKENDQLILIEPCFDCWRHTYERE